jgi:hypothetical protein
MLAILGQGNQAKMQWAQGLIQSNVDNLKVRRKAVRFSRNKEKAYLKVKFEKLLTVPLIY